MCENQPDLFSVWISVCYFDSFKAKVSVSHSALAVKTLICLCTVGGLFYTLHSIPGLTLWFVLIMNSSHKILCDSSIMIEKASIYTMNALNKSSELWHTCVKRKARPVVEG